MQVTLTARGQEVDFKTKAQHGALIYNHTIKVLWLMCKWSELESLAVEQSSSFKCCFSYDLGCDHTNNSKELR